MQKIIKKKKGMIKKVKKVSIRKIPKKKQKKMLIKKQMKQFRYELRIVINIPQKKKQKLKKLKNNLRKKDFMK